MMEILLWIPFVLLIVVVIACQIGYSNPPS
jgi:hypothetical protein